MSWVGKRFALPAWAALMALLLALPSVGTAS
jgi:hypothetical protein